MGTNLIRLSKVTPGRVPVAKSTLYKMRTTKRYPELFIKFGGAVFIDLDELDKILEAGRGKK